MRSGEGSAIRRYRGIFREAVKAHPRIVGNRSADTNDDFLVVDDPAEVYLNEVRKVPPLSREEEISCIGHLRAGDQQAEAAVKRLAEANLILVVSIAERYRNDRIHILDLIQEGNNGLLSALKTFRDGSDIDFSAYAMPHIERAIVEICAAASRQ